MPRPLPAHLLVIALAWLHGGCGRGAAPTPPNVLVVVLDDVAERDIDRVPTPAFDALASRGMRFRRTYAAPTCSPARFMLHFGRYAIAPSGDACEGWEPESSPSTELMSLPRLFADAGYRTVLLGKWHLGGWDGMANGEPWELSAQAHGYDLWRAGLSANVNSACPSEGDYWDWTRVDDGSSTRETTYQTAAVRDAFLSWHASRGPGPWFAVVAFQAPHAPFHLPPPHSRPKDATVRAEPGSSKDNTMERNRAMYERMLTDVDQALGAVLETVDASGTIVIVLADNGTPQNASGRVQLWSKLKKTTYEDGIRVPMVWAGPGIARGESDSLASLVDILPTCAELLSPGSPALDCDGASLMPVLRGEPGTRSYVFAGLRDKKKDDLAVVTERWKYREDHGRAFLFDLEHDREENSNLAGMPGLAEIEGDLRALLDRHRP